MLTISVLVFVATVATAPADAASPSLLRQFCQTGPAGGQCVGPRGIAVDPTSGDAYVADKFNFRIQKFTAWGEFLHAWGWDVVATGPGDDTTTPEDQFEVCVPANGDVCKTGINGSGAGQFGGQTSTGGSEGLALDSVGDLYVVDNSNGTDNRRIQKFSPDGEFLRAWGGDVVATGPGDSSNDETQQVKVAAGGGTFRLSFTNPFPAGGTEQTAPIPHNASASEVEAALEALSLIGGQGGEVSVTGGPGDPEGTTPYEISFEGDLGGDDIPQLALDTSALAQPVGTQLKCETTTSATTISYRWLRNGAPIAGAEASTYTATAADEGAALQCQVTATNANAGTTAIATPPQIVVPFPAAALPTTPSHFVVTTSGPLSVGGSGGQTLTCDPKAADWSGSPTFTYAWYRNGVEISGATSSTYVVTTGDLVSPAVFQCVASGTNAGGTVAKASSQSTTTEPNPEAPGANATLPSPFTSSATTVNQGGAPEVCVAVDGDACKAGVVGTAAGQFSFGSLGSAPAEGSFIAIDPGSPDTIYVGDMERIQRFDTDGKYLGNLPDPGELLKGETVNSLAVDPGSGALYLGRFRALSEPQSKPDVLKLSPAGSLLCTIKAHNPRAIAVGPGGEVYVVKGFIAGGPSIPREIARFNSTCGGEEALFGKELGGSGNKDQFSTDPTAIATSTACGIEGVDLFFNNPSFTNSFVSLYGPPPNPDICPPPSLAPTISDTYALSVDTDGATVAAEINPHFWPDTSYYVQYGTGKCSEGGCEETALFPGSQLGAVVVDAVVKTKGVFLGAAKALSPNTTYRYRFVATSQGGGPTFGPEESFHTPGLPGDSDTGCPNQAFRTGPSAKLPDCRAYELVSPLDKNNSDISEAAGAHDLSSADGNALTFATLAAAYADPAGGALIHQYLSQRGPETGWQTRSITAPRKLPLLYATGDLLFNGSEFKAFSEDLCQGWMLQDADIALAPGAPSEMQNLYRRDNCGEDEGTYELLSPVAAPGWRVGNQVGFFFPTFQGSSADGEMAVFRAPAMMTQGASTDKGTELECQPGVKASSITYRWLRNGVPIAGKTEPTYKTVTADNGKAIQCQVFASNASGGITQVVNPAMIAEPYPATAPPLAPAQIAAPSSDAELTVGGAGAQTLSCDPNETGWQGSPSFTYQWYRNGVAIAAATAQAYLTTPADLATPASFQCLVTATNAGAALAKASDALSTSPAPDTPQLPRPGMSDVYRVYASSEGELHLVSVLPDGNAASTHSSAGTFQGFPFTFKENSVRHAVSADGGRVFWSAGTTAATPRDTGTPGSQNQLGALYLRVNPTQPQSAIVAKKCSEAAKACTLEIAKEGARFLEAAADGSVAFYSVGEELFEYDAAKGIAYQPGASTLIAKGFKGAMGTSEDASRLYFASTEVMPGADESPEGASAQAGKANLYLYQRGVGFEFIGVLSSQIDASVERFIPSPLNSQPQARLSRVSPDGLHAAFTSTAPLTGYDNTDIASGEPDAEVFLYDAAANGGEGELRCASCAPSGARPSAGRRMAVAAGTELWVAARIPGWINQTQPGNALSSDGSRLFFESFEALLPRDSNGRADVYQWEAPGTGTCSTEAPAFSPPNEGCLSLISTGESGQDTELVDASADGRDVFILTGSSLLPQDFGLRDIYDARVNGGFPAPAADPPSCEGEACQGTPTPPEDPTPASSTYEGAGNLKEGAATKPRCPKGRRAVRKAGKTRCLKPGKKQKRAKRGNAKGRAGR
ncbi:MAG TPA: hypothetical protein VNO20_10980 [Solirubrobacterales bacterium]|nr:hypothetical protein [Solirubrobacterales bacterium]